MSKSRIIDMRPVTNLDDPNAPKTYIPVRAEDTGFGDLVTLKDSQAFIERQSVAQPVQERLLGDYKSRAVGFSIKTWQVALLFGVIAWLLARVGAGVPLFSMRALLILALGAGLVWLAAFALDLLLSPAGVAWYNARRFWNHMDREQKERFDYWRNVRQD